MTETIVLTNETLVHGSTATGGARVVFIMSAGISVMDPDEALFRSLLPSLAAQHAGEFVAISRGKIVGIGKSSTQLARQFFAGHGDTEPLFVGFIGDTPVELQPTPIVV